MSLWCLRHPTMSVSVPSSFLLPGGHRLFIEGLEAADPDVARALGLGQGITGPLRLPFS